EVAYSLDPASLVDEDRLHIELWPNLPHARWRRFWLGVEADVVPTAYEYHVYARSPHGYYEPQTRFGGAGDAVRAAHYVSVTGRPRLLWIGTPGKGAGFLAFPDGGRAGNGKPHEATVAVDFGTFRTALLVAVSPGKSELPWPAEGRARLPGHRRTLVDNEDKAPGQRTNRSLFPPTQGPAPAPAAANAVTAGVFGAAIVFPGPDLPGADSVPFQDFSLLDQLPGRLRQYPATAEQNRTGLKWGDDDMTTAARTGYLKAVLLLGAVEAFSLGATVLDVRYSFPLAYELRDALHRSFVEAAAWIERDVLGGLDGAEPAVRLQDPDSESSAGMIAAEAYEDWIVTLDLGGGTLDLGIYHQDTDRPREPVAWDSVRLGADLVTAAYVANTKREPTTVRVELLSGTFKYDNEPLIKDSDRLFQLAMEYAARLVAGTLRTRDERPTGAKVTVVLLGSGWRWDRCRTGSAKFDAESFEHRYGAQMQQRIEQLAPGLVQRVQIHTGLLDREREKLAVAHGLARGTSELRKVRDTIRAPNGLDESGHAWDRMVHQKQAFGTPSAIDARPAFPRELESVAPFNVRLQHTDVSQSILSRLRSETHPTDRYRKRTALGVAYEYMTASWFKR
ncbi:MAG TPA: hypothetical protein VFT22_25615, partial [Kofleriaceae bacterium]|nr:hypothetical protein [Kofleriaceae bacterium]